MNINKKFEYLIIIFKMMIIIKNLFLMDYKFKYNLKNTNLKSINLSFNLIIIV
jgi:hypothetical protein